MNILFVYERFIIPTFGGLERVTHLLATGLKEKGNSVFYLSVGPKEWNREKPMSQFPQFYIPYEDTDPKDFKFKFEEVIKDCNIDVVIFQGHAGEVIKAMKNAPEGIAKISVFHFQPFGILQKERRIKLNTPWSDLGSRGKIIKILGIALPAVYRKIYVKATSKIFRDIFSNSDKLFLLSERFQKDITSNCPGADEAKLDAINNPLTFNPPTEPESYKKENLVVLVARLSNPQKNITGFIDVWKKFHKKHPDWEAKIIGEGDHQKYLQDYARRRKVRKLSFEGRQSNVEDYYKRAKIYCMTSTYEGWGMVLTEAMALGCVPVAFDSYGSVRDIIEDGKSGFLIKPFDNDKMVEAMSVLAADEELRRRMANTGIKKLEKFKVEKIVDIWIEKLNKLLF